MSYNRLTNREDKEIVENGASAIYEREYDEDYLEECYERLLELEDKIENGTLVELPCKVGEVFYEPILGTSKIREWVCTSFNIHVISKGGKQNVYVWAEEAQDYRLHWKFFPFQFGNTVFATKEEAEAKLKELEENENE